MERILYELEKHCSFEEIKYLFKQILCYHPDCLISKNLESILYLGEDEEYKEFCFLYKGDKKINFHLSKTLNSNRKIKFKDYKLVIPHTFVQVK